MEDYIVLILGLIWGGITLYKKSLAKTTEASTNRENNKKPKKSLFEEFFEEKFTEHNYTDESYDDVVIEEEERFSTENKSKIDYTNVVNKQSNREENGKISKERVNINLESYDEEQDYEEENWFNLRDAVIYSQIMNKSDY